MRICCSFEFNTWSSMMQSQYDYLLGNYPVGKDDAAQLAALQILAEIGSVATPELSSWVIWGFKEHLCRVNFFFCDHQKFVMLRWCFILLCREWPVLMEKYIPKQVTITRPKKDWESDILSRYRAMVWIFGDNSIRSFPTDGRVHSACLTLQDVRYLCPPCHRHTCRKTMQGSNF